MKTFAILATVAMLFVAGVVWDQRQPTACVVAVAAALYFLETLVGEMDSDD